MSDSAPSLKQTIKVWGKIGLLSFGGPAAQIALMHREVVDQRKWLTENQFLNALSFCMLLPGPEAMQLATYAGWRMHGTLGGLIAGLLFVLPGAVVMMALAAFYVSFGTIPLVEGLFLGVKAAVIVIVVEALLRVANKALHGNEGWLIALLSFIGIFFFALPFPLIVLAAGVYGYFASGGLIETESAPPGAQPLKQAISTAGIWLFVWLFPLFALWLALPESMLSEIGVFFSKLAVVTFGGAYAVLAYMGQDVVQNSQWLTAGEMMDGLGLAETTPGPLILVTQFVGFLAAHKEGGMMFGVSAAVVTLWVTFTPCFLWIFTGAPYIDWIAHQPRIKGALSAITAAVVGVILNLSIWFALHVFFTSVTTKSIGILVLQIPDFATLDWRVVVLTFLAALGLLKFHLSMPLVLLIASLLGMGVYLI